MADLLNDTDNLGDDQEHGSQYDAWVMIDCRHRAVAENADGALEVTDFCVVTWH